MIFTTQEYKKMKAAINDCLKNNKPVDIHEAIKLDVDYDALISLYSQMFIKYQKSELKSIDRNDWSIIASRVKRGESLQEVSKQYRLGPYLFARTYMEFISGEKKFNVPNFLANPSIVTDEALRNEIIAMFGSDPLCSHEVELLKECVGREYEELLNSLLSSRHMCFETESQLRALGKRKTPDVKFLIPMAITVPKRATGNRNSKRRHSTAEGEDLDSRLASTSFDDSIILDNPIDFNALLNETANDMDDTPSTPTNNSNNIRYNRDKNNVEEETTQLIINWIDSKAMFADINTFKGHLEQFRAYNNRYGRGLVIYWHGLVEDVMNSEEIGEDQMIVVTDRFPDSWMFPTGELADGRVPQFESYSYSDNTNV